MRCPWLYQPTIPSISHHLVAARHVRHHERKSGKGRLEQGARHAFAIFCRQDERICHAQERRNIAAWPGRDDVRGMTLDLGAAHRERTFARPRADEEKAHTRSCPVHKRCGFEQSWDSLLPGQTANRYDNLGITQGKRPTQLRGGLSLRNGPIEAVEVYA
jgi:hypothetical protein